MLSESTYEGRKRYFPLDPTITCGGSQIQIAASRTHPITLKGRSCLPQGNAHFKSRAILRFCCQFHRANLLVIPGAHNVKIALLYVTMSNTIFAVTSDDMVEVLVCKMRKTT